jgi:hypothetical protein
MKIYKKLAKIIIEIPEWSKRHNPYMPDEDVGEYKTLTGLIIRNRKNGNDYDEIGLATTLDMDYADKPDQVGDFVIKWHEGEEEFRKICKELEISIQELTFQ